tara:strand:+ start:1948 stop:3465 length:1518 start_codon:yes stop_codon:yes gene_type:complete
MKKRFALISLYDKKNIKKICQVLNKFNIGIISTSSTAKYISKLGFPCKSVSSLTKFKEVLDGRVKTLHPKIHASLLFNRDNNSHSKSFKKMKFPQIDFLIVNFYPFQKTLLKKNHKNIIEMIDIGGPALVRSSAKNHKFITTVCDTKDYNKFIDHLKINKGFTKENFRKKLASKAFNITSKYDLKISDWLNDKNKIIKTSYSEKKNKLRYGENPNQKAFFIKNSSKKTFFENLIQGKKLSYNNILDVDSAFNCLQEFSEPTCIIIKHNNPCGASSNLILKTAFINALNSDKISAFGGIVAFNRTINIELAKLLKKNYFEIIIANNFTENAKKILSNKKNLILIETKNINTISKNEVKSVEGGYLFQNKNKVKINKKNLICVSKRRASKKNIDDLVFCLKICKHVKSNAIVLAKNKKIIAVGAGQPSRIGATKVAISKIKKNLKRNGFVAASDAFFPFTDSVKLLSRNNCKAIVQPRGSINDNKIIEYINKNKLSLFFSKNRFFKH